MALHDNEYSVDDELVRQLLIEQMPDWSDLPLQRLETGGTVNIAYRLGSDMLVRLPRTADFSSGPDEKLDGCRCSPPAYRCVFPHITH